MRGSNLIKFLRTIDLLSRPQGATIDELADELNVVRKSASRMLDIIQEMHFPIYQEADPDDARKKRWKFIDTYQNKLPNLTVPEIKLSVSELIALYLLKGEEKLYKGTEVEKKIDSAFSKISLFMPADVPLQLDKLRALFLSVRKLAKEYADKEEIIDQLTEAMLQCKTCVVRYHSFVDDEVKTFRIDPLHFFENQGGLYLFVNVPRYNDIRILAVERIKELTSTDDQFVYPKNFNPQERLESTFDVTIDDEKTYKIWFAQSQAKYIKERTWSPNQEINEQDDGSIILTMSTSGMYDVMRWAMQYGSDAEVLEPEELRQDMIKDISLMQQRYSS